ncbi:MAG: hypothetical protein Q7S86_02810 [bacterium]|nr:hypothetical protein [bacterium]
MKTRKNNSWKEYGTPFLLGFALVGGLFMAIRPSNKEAKLPEDIAIILSPHFDDAVLSMGGFMADRKKPLIVATFFTEKPPEPVQAIWDSLSGFKNSDEAIAVRVEENVRALGRTGTHAINMKYLDFQYRHDRDPDSEEKILQSMEKDIKTILDTFGTVENVSIYGPSEFGPDITHPDHKLVHDAFFRVAREKSAQQNLRFFFYEDFPYVSRYQVSTTTPLQNFLLETNIGLTLRELELPLSPAELEEKIKSIKAYASQEKAFESLGADIVEETRTFTETRCKKTNPASLGCEVVYEIK